MESSTFGGASLEAVLCRSASNKLKFSRCTVCLLQAKPVLSSNHHQALARRRSAMLGSFGYEGHLMPAEFFDGCKLFLPLLIAGEGIDGDSRG